MPDSVRALVGSAWRALLVARTLESLLVGGTAACLTLAAAARGSSLAAEPRLELAAVAVCAGLLGALAWFLEHRSSAEELALLLDRRLGQRGALAVAFELEGRPGAPSAMGALLRERVLLALDPKDALRSSVPSFFLPLALTALAAGALLLTLEQVRTPDRAEPELARWIQAAGAALAPASADPAAERATLAALGQRLAELERRSRAGGPAAEDPRATAAELAALDAELARAAAALEPTSAARDRIEEARAWIDAARAWLLRAGGAAPAPGTAPGTGDGGGPATAPSPGGTMDGSPMARETPNEGGLEPPADRALPADDLPSGAPPAGIRFEATYADVVRRWVELSREARQR